MFSPKNTVEVFPFDPIPLTTFRHKSVRLRTQVRRGVAYPAIRDAGQQLSCRIGFCYFEHAEGSAGAWCVSGRNFRGTRGAPHGEAPRSKERIMAFRWMCAIALLATLTAHAEPRTITVPGDFPTVKAAVEAAAPGDTVLIKPGQYQESLVIDKPITLRGEAPRTGVAAQHGAGGERNQDHLEGPCASGKPYPGTQRSGTGQGRPRLSEPALHGGGQGGNPSVRDAQGSRMRSSCGRRQRRAGPGLPHGEKRAGRRGDLRKRRQRPDHKMHADRKRVGRHHGLRRGRR